MNNIAPSLFYAAASVLLFSLVYAAPKEPEEVQLEYGPARPWAESVVMLASASAALGCLVWMFVTFFVSEGPLRMRDMAPPAFAMLFAYAALHVVCVVLGIRPRVVRKSLVPVLVFSGGLVILFVTAD